MGSREEGLGVAEFCNSQSSLSTSHLTTLWKSAHCPSSRQQIALQSHCEGGHFFLIIITEHIVTKESLLDRLDIFEYK